MKTDLIVNKNYIESLSIEIFFGKKTLINVLYRPPSGSATTIDHILTNCFVNFDFKTAFFRSDISDHSLISFFLPITNEFSKIEPIYIRKRIINNNAIEMSKVTRN